MKKLAILFALLGVVGAANAAVLTHGSLGVGHGVNVPGKDAAPCNGAVLNLNYDGSGENGYCWQYGGCVPPQYGAFAECYSFVGPICGVELLLSSIGNPSQPADLFIWADAGGVPGTVIATANVAISGVPLWPNIAPFDFALAGTVNGAFWTGYFANFSNQGCGYFIAADLNGFGGCPMTNIAPGIGYPTGWNNVSVVWGATQAIGIGAWAGQSTPAKETTWGSIKHLYN